MIDTQEILVENFRESLRQIHGYVVWGIGTSVSFFGLALLSPKSSDAAAPISVPGAFVAVDPVLAQVILVAGCVVVGAMAGYAAEQARDTAKALENVSGLLPALRTFPGIATSPYPGVRYIASLLPLVLVALGLIAVPFVLGNKVQWAPVAIAMLFVFSAYFTLALELRGLAVRLWPPRGRRELVAYSVRDEAK
jgi:hypothetical protein